MQTPRAVTGCPEASAETRLTELKTSTGCQSGQRAAMRASGSRRRQSHRSVSRVSADSDNVSGQPEAEDERPEDSAAERGHVDRRCVAQ